MWYVTTPQTPTYLVDWWHSYCETLLSLSAPDSRNSCFQSDCLFHSWWRRLQLGCLELHTAHRDWQRCLLLEEWGWGKIGCLLCWKERGEGGGGGGVSIFPYTQIMVLLKIINWNHNHTPTTGCILTLCIWTLSYNAIVIIQLKVGVHPKHIYETSHCFHNIQMLFWSRMAYDGCSQPPYPKSILSCPKTTKLGAQ